MPFDPPCFAPSGIFFDADVLHIVRGVMDDRVVADAMGPGDLLIRHPWALHRGTPNTTDTPRALITLRYVRRWYTDDSRDVNSMGRATWESLTAEQRRVIRFPVRDNSTSPTAHFLA